LVKSNLPVHLLGTLLADVPENSLATILDSTTRRAQTYRQGDKLAEAEVVEIQRRRVIIFNKRLEFIDGLGDSGAGPPQHPPSPGPSSGSSTAGIQVWSLSDHEYELRRDELNELLANANDLLTQARFMPEARNGSAPGFRALSIRPDSFFAKIGLRVGDLIRRVNGYDLNSIDKALELFAKLREAGRIDLEFERNGKTVQNVYSIR
jgi:general secretion pathway protein C